MITRINVGTGAVVTAAEDAPVFSASAAGPDKAAVEQEFNRRVESAVKALVGRAYSKAERATWPSQLMEALTLQNDPNTDVANLPIISGLAASDGVTVEEYAARVLARNAAFRAITTPLLGAQNALLKMDPIPADFRNDEYWT